jgi:TRAP-type C4-dicarboxylate transport system permease large subunit
MGMNIFILRGVLPDIPMLTMYRGVVPFIIADIFRAGVIILVPALALWLPSYM